MKVRIWVAAAVLGAAASCAPKDSCGGAVCTAEQRCAPSKVCVTDKAPTLTLDAPVDQQVVNSTGLEVKGKAEDDDAAPTVEVAVNEANWKPVTLGADGAFSTQVTLPAADNVAATLSVRATDTRGRTVKVARAVRLDNVAPACALTAPRDGAMVTTLGVLAVTLTSSDGSALVNPRVSTDGALTFAPAPGSAFEWAVPSANGAVHALVFRVDDSAGNACEAKATVTVDNQSPTVGFTTPDAGSLLGVGSFVFSGLVSDGARLLKSVTLSFADAGTRPATFAGNQWSISATGPAGADFKSELATVVATDLAGNTASATRAVTIDVVSPVVTFTAPAANAKLNAAAFASGNTVALAWTLTDGDPQPSIGIALPDGGVQSPPVVTTSPTDNPVTYQPVLVATDRAGNSSTATVSFSVDRVAPTLTVTPANDTRMYGGRATAAFSEPVGGSSGLTLVPPVPGVWTTPQLWTSEALTADAVYAASAGPVSDLHGNPIAPSSSRFHTATWAPTPGTTLVSGIAEVSAVITDPEGALTLLAISQSSTMDWIQFDSSTGAATLLRSFALSDQTRLPTSWRAVRQDLSSERRVGVTIGPTIAPQVHFRIGPSSVMTMVGEVFIPMPPFAIEGASSADYGVIRAGAYRRGGRPDVVVDLAAIHQIRFSDFRWEITEHAAGVNHAQSFGCYQPPGFGNPPPVCNTTPVKTVPVLGVPSEAISRTCSAHSGSAGSTALFRWQPTCGQFGNQPPCTNDSTATGPRSDVVSDPSNNGVFYSLVQITSTQVQVQRLAVDAACAGAWVNFKGPITLPNAGERWLVVFRSVPGIIVTDNGDVKLISP